LTYRRTILNITCELLNLYLDDGTAIAEWEATFDDTAQQVRKRMREVALLTFDGPLIDSLREYWASEELPAAASPTSSATRTGNERPRALHLSLDPPIRECGRCFPDAVRALSADARKE